MNKLTNISELSKLLNLVNPKTKKPLNHVIRYWETEFPQLKPPKNRAGNRTYRQKDINLILQIKDLLYNKKFTIDGARVVLKKSNKIKNEITSSSNFGEKQKLLLKKVKEDLIGILSIISK